MIEVRNLSKHYGELTAVDGVSFVVNAGEVLGLLGPNGAGKTTTLRMLATVLEPSSGSIALFGSDLRESVHALREQIGYLPDDPPLYKDLTVLEMLEFMSRVRGIPRSERAQKVESALETCKLEEVRKQVCGRLSRGYRQRVGLAQAIVHSPKVLLLDEPMTGLDPKQIHEFRGLIRSLAQSSAIVFSTHVLSEVSALCDKVVVIDRGRITLARELNQDRDVSSVENMFLAAVANY